MAPQHKPFNSMQWAKKSSICCVAAVSIDGCGKCKRSDGGTSCKLSQPTRTTHSSIISNVSVCLLRKSVNSLMCWPVWIYIYLYQKCPNYNVAFIQMRNTKHSNRTWDVPNLRWCLTTMSQQTFNRNFGADAILKQFVFEVIFWFLDIITSATAKHIVGWRFFHWIDHHMVTIDNEQSWILCEKFLQTYNENDGPKRIEKSS